MKFDIVYVTYNSKKWIKNNIESINKSDYDLKKVSLYFYDNNSKDDTVDELVNMKRQYGNLYNEFRILKGKKNLGFGGGNNKAAKLGNSKYIFFLNIDTEIEVDTLSKLAAEIEKSDEKVAIFELRQKPYEHPKYYDPITQYTTWASGACFVIKRDIFEKIKGFDKKLFMYCEDVELSWHVRKNGYFIKYLYQVPINHYSYTEPNEFKETQYIYAIVNNLYLRAKYGNFKNLLKSFYIFLRVIHRNNTKLTDIEYKKLRKKIIKEYIKMCFKSIPAIIFKLTHRTKGDFKAKFINDLDYEVGKLDPFYILEKDEAKSLVSIIVRTCGRPDCLRETLISLRNQTYKNIEIVVVEDGKNTSEEMIKNEFSDLNIVYRATGTNVGRSKVGNIAMELASGKYLNFLDDDDAFYPDHVSILVNELEKNNYDIVYSTAFETVQNVKSRSPYVYEIKDYLIRFHGNFSKVKLYKNNITPIQAVMFSKEVFLNCGGFDENIDALEDWDLWINFSLKYRFHHIERTTSIYRVPFDNVITNERQKFLDSSLDYLTKKHENDVITLNSFDIFWNE